jgi:Txe/YoeB family toxin of Txe-Axe toxin-antitoxin module
MKLPSKVKFSDKKVQEAFENLANSTPDEKKVYEWLLRAFDDIEENAFCGIQIPKRLIPKEYKAKYSINNLWKYNLPNAWRLLYSVENGEIIVVSIVLEWMNHKDYEKKFKY